jgi:hypothetical protein
MVLTLDIVFVAFVSLADVGRENKRAKGYGVVTLAECTSVAAGDCIPTTMFAMKSCSVSITALLVS